MTLVLLNLFRTLLLELPILLLFFRKQWKSALIFGFFLNLFTLPLVSYAIYELKLNWYVGELAVLFTEFGLIWLYFRPKWWYAFLAAFTTNIVSAYFFKIFPQLYW